jgi:hypothetical protein
MRNRKLDIAVDGTYRLATLAVAGIAGIFAGWFTLGVTKVIFHFGFEGAFGHIIGELLEQAGLTEDIFRAGVALQPLIYEFV